MCASQCLRVGTWVDLISLCDSHLLLALIWCAGDILWIPWGPAVWWGALHHSGVLQRRDSSTAQCAGGRLQPKLLHLRLWARHPAAKVSDRFHLYQSAVRSEWQECYIWISYKHLFAASAFCLWCLKPERLSSSCKWKDEWLGLTMIQRDKGPQFEVGETNSGSDVENLVKL